MHTLYESLHFPPCYEGIITDLMGRLIAVIDGRYPSASRRGKCLKMAFQTEAYEMKALTS